MVTTQPVVWYGIERTIKYDHIYKNPALWKIPTWATRNTVVSKLFIHVSPTLNKTLINSAFCSAYAYTWQKYIWFFNCSKLRFAGLIKANLKLWEAFYWKLGFHSSTIKNSSSGPTGRSSACDPGGSRFKLWYAGCFFHYSRDLEWGCMQKSNW